MRAFIAGYFLPLFLTFSLVLAFQATYKKPISQEFSNLKIPVYSPHFLLPFTKKEDLIPCKTIFNETLAYSETLAKSNKLIFKEKSIFPDIPNCFVVKLDSYDVKTTPKKVFNYISFPFFGTNKILGFYEDTNKTLYIIENIDSEKVYRHECLHYFLDIAYGDANAAHDHAIWGTVEPPDYTPSEEAFKAAGLEKPEYITSEDL